MKADISKAKDYASHFLTVLYSLTAKELKNIKIGLFIALGIDMLILQFLKWHTIAMALVLVILICLAIIIPLESNANKSKKQK